jgi:hypothetical protein
MHYHRHFLHKAAAVGALMAAAAGTARADAFAQSILVIDNFRLLHASGVAYSAADFRTLAGTNDAHASAQLNGSYANATESVGIASGNNPDLAHQQVGSSSVPIEENRFANSPFLPGASGSFGYADQHLSGSALSVDGAPAGARAATRSDAALTENGQASGNAGVGTSTTLSFTLDQADTMTIAFDAMPFTQALVTANVVANASASLSWTISLFDVSEGVTVFSYSPEALNALSNVSRGDAAPGTTSYNPGTLRLSASTGLLVGGNTYQITIAHGTLANANQERVLPEPGSLALVGLGLLAWTALGRRNKT